jgi:hypothetical protein
MFYNKLGNNAFTPSIVMESILLDNSIVVEGTSSTTSNNDIEIDLKIESKQNYIDSFLEDSEYLEFTKITFIVLNDNENALRYANIILAASYNPTTLLEIPSAQKTTISILDYVEQNQVNGNYAGLYEGIFSNIDKKNGDITLLIIPWVDFSEFAAKNNISEENVKNAIKNVYKNEVHIYTILNNNTVPKNNIVNDVRDLQEFKNNLFTLLPNINSANYDLLNTNSSKKKYFSDLYDSVDYANKKIKLYTTFNVKDFINNFASLQKSYSSYTDEQLNEIFRTEPISISINKTYSTSDEVTSVGSISLSLKEVRSSDVNAEMMSIVDFGDNMLLSFEDEMPTSATNINYTFQILFTDPVLKKFYINDDTDSDLYSKVVSNFSKLQSLVNVDNPSISDSKTGKFTTTFINQYQQSQFNIASFVNDYVALLNLFIQKDIGTEQVAKIVKLLDIKQSTIFVFIDLYYYITSTLFEMENLFSQIKNSSVSYNKNFDAIKVEPNKASFDVSSLSDALASVTQAATPAQQSQGQTKKVPLDILSYSGDIYNISFQKTQDTKTQKSLIKNSVVTTLNNEIQFSTNFDFSNYFNDSKGLVKKDSTTEYEVKQKNGKNVVSKKTKTSPQSLINNSFGNSTNVVLNIPLSTTRFGTAIQTKVLKDSSPVETIKEKIQKSQSEAAKDEFLSAISTTIEEANIVQPEIVVEYLSFKNNNYIWQPVPNNAPPKQYFVRKVYSTTDDLYSKNNIEPIISNKYEILNIRVIR